MATRIISVTPRTTGGVAATVGTPGPRGPVGATGPAGSQGTAGPRGLTGATGATGPAGAKGDTGPAGPTGATGAAGSAGAAGATGPAGAVGAQGPKGDTGAAGSAGATGQQGAKGDTGAPGAAGAQGATGAAGQGFTFRGAWAANTAYAPYDVVTYGGSTYEASAAFTSGATFSAANWSLWAAAATTSRVAVADQAYTATASDRYISYTGLTTSRIVTLPAASAFPTATRLTIADETGNCSAAKAIVVARAGSDTIDGAVSVPIFNAYGSAVLVSDGSSKWTVVEGTAAAKSVTLAASGVQAPLTGSTAETVLAAVKVPANALGPNGRLRIIYGATTTGSTNAKTLRVRFGSAGDLTGTLYNTATNSGAASIALRPLADVGNRGTTNNQVGYSSPGIGANAGTAMVTSAIDTTADSFLVISGQLALSTETISLEYYSVEVLRS